RAADGRGGSGRGCGRRDLPRGERRASVGARLGRRAFDGYRVPAGHARASRPALSRSPPPAHAHGRRGRRRRRARRHRARVCGVAGGFLADAFRSPITLGILFGYVVGKPVGVVGGSWLVARLSGGRLRPPVGWVAVAGGGTIAGIGFTVSLLIATLAFDGRALD